MNANSLSHCLVKHLHFGPGRHHILGQISLSSSWATFQSHGLSSHSKISGYQQAIKKIWQMLKEKYYSPASVQSRIIISTSSGSHEPPSSQSLVKLFATSFRPYLTSAGIICGAAFFSGHTSEMVVAAKRFSFKKFKCKSLCNPRVTFSIFSFFKVAS